MYKIEDIKVFPININKLSEDTSKSVNRELEIREDIAVIMQPRFALVDKEMFLVEFTEKDNSVTLTFYDKPIKNDDGSQSIPMLPAGTAKLTVDELKEYFQEQTTLADFVKERRNYNSRIRSNECEVIDWLQE